MPATYLRWLLAMPFPMDIQAAARAVLAHRAEQKRLRHRLTEQIQTMKEVFIMSQSTIDCNAIPETIAARTVCNTGEAAKLNA